MPRILVADDNTNIQKMVSLALEERGVSVVSVGNGEAAVRRIPDLNPDLVLADVFMPVRNGYEVCEFVKKDTRFAHVPVILLVGAFDPLDEKEARRVGADGVLKKPFVPPDPLIAMVMSALEKNPKIAAELAKARETPAEPPPPPMPAMEIPAKAEPKPLPEFPEPSPEEAAQIYGFGKGVRSLDNEQPGAKSPKGPVVEAGEAEEEFDGSSTASDWRRNAGGDLEIPENTASDPAYSFGRDLAPITFPSERDVPPKKIRVTDTDLDRDAAAKERAPSAEPEALQPAAKQNVPEISTKPEPAPVSSASSGGWMEMMSPAPSEYPETGWATEDSPASRSSAVEEPARSSAVEETSPTPAMDTTSRAATFDRRREPEPVAAAPVVTESSAPAVSESSVVAEETEAAVPETKWEAHEDAEPKKKSWFTDAVEAVREAVHGIVQESQPEIQAEDRRQTSPDLAPEPVESTAHDLGSQWEVAHVEMPRSSREPGLEEPPAPRVTPEPLLIDENAPVISDYKRRVEETAPIHSFLPPAVEQHPFDEPAAESAPPAEEFFAPSEEPQPAEREPVEVKSESPQFSERIPTAPPPNREALAEIPFLMPPPSIHEPEKVDNGTVDAVVARVLERLEPQLHALLSKGLLKPLVENMLHDELAKKDK
ncbi:MAG TPA: response regulator [Candidatus Limnocylindrales bacterium]|nr:response regulator [Candidatus Limnocylindrales bacterium]